MINDNVKENVKYGTIGVIAYIIMAVTVWYMFPAATGSMFVSICSFFENMVHMIDFSVFSEMI